MEADYSKQTVNKIKETSTLYLHFFQRVMPSFQDLPKELQFTVMSLLPSSSLRSLENTDFFLDHDDFQEVASEQRFGDLARAALVGRQWRCLAEDPL